MWFSNQCSILTINWTLQGLNGALHNWCFCFLTFFCVHCMSCKSNFLSLMPNFFFWYLGNDVGHSFKVLRPLSLFNFDNVIVIEWLVDIKIMLACNLGSPFFKNRPPVSSNITVSVKFSIDLRLFGTSSVNIFIGVISRWTEMKSEVPN